MKAVLTQLQQITRRTGVETCGHLYRDRAGKLKITPISRGGESFCDQDWQDRPDRELLAFFHSHGLYEPEIDSEVPTAFDIRSIMAPPPIDGWVVTPGGRIWHLDAASRSARLICGIGCAGSDPEFVKGDWGPIKNRYTLRELQRREAQ